jgi:hypothetical protein
MYWHTNFDLVGTVRFLILSLSSLISNRVVYCSMVSLRCLVIVAKFRMRDWRYIRVDSLLISLWSKVSQRMKPSAWLMSDEDTKLSTKEPSAFVVDRNRACDDSVLIFSLNCSWLFLVITISVYFVLQLISTRHSLFHFK